MPARIGSAAGGQLLQQRLQTAAVAGRERGLGRKALQRSQQGGAAAVVFRQMQGGFVFVQLRFAAFDQVMRSLAAARMQGGDLA